MTELREYLARLGVIYGCGLLLGVEAAEPKALAVLHDLGTPPTAPPIEVNTLNAAARQSELSHAPKITLGAVERYGSVNRDGDTRDETFRDYGHVELVAP